ncbi:hypothetical protein CANARDRAFT_6302 [[Candida] arabinofermentans NRRL YB-2248]|uniref:Structural maintenance of chromosomes protein 5 n=1 Tax=[Candida] arabinofermentans NRRL YB-2248 TaxID=983967 RepID=A0A1E4T4P7_9ASCO|nr:hypothetical protein CANARDRAFT_6302 [[Candida] arabinofermentans NRRL YB-2248]
MTTRLASASELNLAEYLPKKLRASYVPDLAAFSKGSIIRIKLRNFMSYELTEFHFGPTMNLIIGPNGTGKSTVVCAICIGLAGKLEYLGKASMNLDQFIKTGAQKASIEIELKGIEDGTVIISRELFRKQSASSWKVDRKASSESAVKKILKQYNIQLNNLCQFLPQDRVSRFASLKPEELLREIERSYGDGELLIEHNTLIKNYIDREESKKALDDLQNEKTSLLDKNEALRVKAVQFQEYQILENDLRLYERLKPLAGLTTKKAERDKLKFEMTELNDKIRNYDLRILPLKRRLLESDVEFEDIEQKKQKYMAKKASSSEKITKYMEEVKAADARILKLKEERESLSANLEKLKEKYQTVLGEYREAKGKIEKLERTPPEEIQKMKDERDSLKDRIVDEGEPVFRKRSELQTLNKQNESLDKTIKSQQELLQSGDRLLALDKHKFGNLIKIAELLRQHAKAENLNYFEPPILSISPTNSQYSPALEHVIRYANLVAFTVKNHQDYKKLAHFLYTKHKEIGKNASIRTLGSNYKENISISSSEIKTYGFDGFISDFIKGPPEVIQMLNENESLHTIPISMRDISDQEKSNLVQKIKSGSLQLHRYISYDSIYQFNRSNFGNKQVSTNIRTFQSRSLIFNAGLSPERKAEVERKIASLQDAKSENQLRVKTIEKEIFEEEKSLNELALNRDRLTEKISQEAKTEKQFEKLDTQCQTLQARLRVHKRDIKKHLSKDKEGEVLKILSNIKKYQEKKIELFSLMQQEIAKSSIIDQEQISAEVLLIQEKNKKSAIESLHEKILSYRDQLTGTKIALKDSYKQAKQDYVTAVQEYKADIELLSEEEKNRMREMHDKLRPDGEPISEELLNGEIQKVKSQMKLRRTSDGQATIKELEDNEKKLTQLESVQIPAFTKTIDELDAQIDELFSVWKPKLESIVKSINDDFSVDLATVASAGEVRLDSESPNFAEWKLNILVSFREGQQLTQLNAAQQSGGEKSATTAVFLNSLQGLTNTPFRVVDEINQGMDSNNERLIHKLIVSKACSQKNSSQYFLITPKLLTNLYYGEGMTIHCILAGKWAPEPADNVGFLEMGISDKYF